MAVKTTRVGRRGTVKVDVSLLDALTKGIGQHLVTRVGILGSGANRVIKQKDEGEVSFRKRVREFKKTGAGSDAATNADIGLAHEKGIKSKNLPRRSWLEEPLTDHLSEHFAKLGKKALVSMLQSNYKAAYADLGIVAEIIIQKGFESGGYGKWAPLKHRIGTILVDTAQLRRSVTSEVVAK